ncbi:hypothetical protein RCC89_05430 [Cytophagaceae bacterium ABcell3]|nr:hypothetical protein RCC89_05430 [Cytophagaceae bacterium ABcell3]
MNFILGFINYDIASGTPALPGYPILYTVINSINFFTHSLSTAFAVAGGISTWLIIYYTSRILRVTLFSLEGGLTGFLIFFNTSIWLMGNKFLPDLMALAIALPVFYYLLVDNFKARYLYKGWFLAGLLPGVMFSYIPLIVLPAIYALVKKRRFIWSIPFLLTGILLWLVPFTIYIGPSQLWAYTEMYFNSLMLTAGTANTGPGFIEILEGIWAEGLTGYIPGRNLLAIFTSLPVIALLFFGLMITLSFGHSKPKMLIGLASLSLFLIFSYIFRDSNNLHRHILPFLPFLMIFICYGIIYFLVNFNFMLIKVIISLFLILYVSLNTGVVSDNSKPTAIASMSKRLLKKDLSDVRIVSYPQINQYLKDSGVEAASFEDKGALLQEDELHNTLLLLPEGYPVPDNYSERITEKHNPMINRQWTQLTLYNYK